MFIFLFLLITFASITVSNTPIVYGQTNQILSENAGLLNIQNIPAKKVHVGDIDIGYKMLGKGDLFYFSMALLIIWMPGIRPF
jgi:hypothetical protein